MRTFVILFLLLISTSSFAQWTKMKTPSSGYSAFGISTVNSNSFLLTAKGLYSMDSELEEIERIYAASINAAIALNDLLVIFPHYQDSKIKYIDTSIRPWTVESTDIRFIEVRSIVKVDSTLYYGSSPGGVHIIEDLKDRGFSRQINNGLPSNSTGCYVNCLATKDKSLFAASGNSIYTCQTGEHNWTPLDIDFSYGRAIFMKFVGETMYIGVNDQSFREGHREDSYSIYKSDDLGASFQQYKAETLGTLSGLIIQDSIHYLSLMGEGIFFSEDSGASWHSRNFGLQDHQIQSIKAIDVHLYSFSNRSGAYILKDTTWSLIHLKEPVFSATSLISENNQLFISTSDSIYKVGMDHKWENITPPNPEGLQFRQMVKKSDKLVVSGFLIESNHRMGWDLFLMNEMGVWEQRNTPFDSSITQPESINYDGHRIYIASGTTYYSDTQGWTWAYGANEIRPYYMAVISPWLFLANSDIVVRLTTNPRVFNWIYLRDIFGSAGFNLDGRDEIDYFCSCNNALFLKHDHWNPEKRHGLLRSTDLGMNWETVNHGQDSLFHSTVNVLGHTCSGSTLVLITKSEFLISQDLGDNWQVIERPTFSSYGSAAIRNDSLYVASIDISRNVEQGIWIHPLKFSTTSKKIDSSKPHIAIYPNPAKDFFYIEVDSPDPNFETRIFNSSGQLLHTEKNRSGDRISVNALSPGVYFVQVLLKESTQTLKVFKNF